MTYIIKLKQSNQSSDLDKYINLHGKHFTDSLAEYASSLMINTDESSHSWNTQDMHNQLLSLNLSIPQTSSFGDIVYTANMAYADFYPKLLVNKEDCILYALEIANDKDGYEGIQFCRWLADITNKNIKIDWSKYI